MIGAFLDEWLSGWRGRTLLAVLLVVLIAFPWLAGEDGRFYTLLLMTVFIFATLGHAWNLLAGYCGLLSFGLQVYVGLGGFTVGLLNFYGGAHVWLALPVAGVAAALFAWLLAVPVSDRFSGRRIWIPVAIAVVLWIVYELLIRSNPVWDVFGGDYVRRVSILLLIFLGALPLLRLPGAYFAVATWLIAAAVASIFGGWEVVGAGGGLNIPSDTTLAERYYVGLVILAASTLAVWWLLRSKYGLALTAVRDDEEAAMTVGVDVRRAKTLVFLISAPMVGLAGGLFYIDNVTITLPDAFHIRWSAFIVFVVVAGGMGSLAGPIVGAVIYVIVDRLVAGYLGTGELALGIFAVLIILLLPRGLMGVVTDLRARGSAGGRGGSRPISFARGASAGGAPAPASAGAPSEPPVPAGPPGVVAAFLVPGNPLPCLKPDNPPWQAVATGFEAGPGGARPRPPRCPARLLHPVDRGPRSALADPRALPRHPRRRELVRVRRPPLRPRHRHRARGQTGGGNPGDGDHGEGRRLRRLPHRRRHHRRPRGTRPGEALSAGDHREQPLSRLRDHPPAGRHGGAGSDTDGPAGRGRRGRWPLRLDLHPGDRHRRRSHRQPSRRGMEPACAGADGRG